MKRFISLALIMAFLLLSAGCSDGGKADVYFLNFKPESAKVYNQIADKYEEETVMKKALTTTSL